MTIILFINDNNYFSIGNIEYDTKTYFTNFRILVFSEKIIYDVPLCFIKTHYIKVKQNL